MFSCPQLIIYQKNPKTLMVNREDFLENTKWKSMSLNAKKHPLVKNVLCSSWACMAVILRLYLPHRTPICSQCTHTDTSHGKQSSNLSFSSFLEIHQNQACHHQEARETTRLCWIWTDSKVSWQRYWQSLSSVLKLRYCVSRTAAVRDPQEGSLI